MHDQERAMAVGAGLALTALALAFAPLGSGAAAQASAAPSERQVLFLSAADMAKGTATGIQTLGMGGTYSYHILLRDKTGEVEVHDNRNDIIVVQEGRAAMLLGGTVAGGRVTALGEHRGGTLTGARSQPLAPGDVLFIPARMPHLMKLPVGVKRFRYLVVKTQP